MCRYIYRDNAYSMHGLNTGECAGLLNTPVGPILAGFDDLDDDCGCHAALIRGRDVDEIDDLNAGINAVTTLCKRVTRMDALVAHTKSDGEKE